MLRELWRSLREWRLVHLLGLSVLRARYARSYLGQFWLTLTTLAQIAAVGATWSFLWGQSVDAFLPYYGAGFIIFSFVSRMLTESSVVLAADARYYLNGEMPFMVSVLALLYRGAIVFLHDLPVLLLLLLWSDSARLTLSPAFPGAVGLLLLFTLFAAYFVALVAARFRDLVQIVTIVIANLLLLSPVMWQMEQIPEPYRRYFYLNPFTAILTAVRNPLLGMQVDAWAYLYLAVWTGIAGLLAALAHRVLAARLIFWI